MRAVLAVALVLLASTLTLAADKPAPKYEGKPLEYWVERLQQAENDKDRDSAAEALRAFGPDAASALPTLIEMLADHSLSYRTRVVGIVAAIGPKAKDARPVIVKLIRDKKTAWYDGSVDAVVAISDGAKDAASALVPLLEVEGWELEVYRASAAWDRTRRTHSRRSDAMC